MTEERPADDGAADEGHDEAAERAEARDRAAETDVTAADRQAMAALFSALAADPPESEFSPLEIVRAGRREERVAAAKRLGRLRLGRNLLVAAAAIGAVALLVPLLQSSSSQETAASSSSSSAAASGVLPGQNGAAAGSAADGFSAAASGPASSAAPRRPAAADGSSAGSAASAPGPAGPSAASSSAAAATSAAASGAESSDAASSGPASSAPASAGAASSGAAQPPKTADTRSNDGNVSPASGTGSTPRVGCTSRAAEVLGAAGAAFPAGYFSRVDLTSCRLFGTAAEPGAQLAVAVTKGSVGACATVVVSGQPVCQVVPGSSPPVYRRTVPGTATSIWVYGGGYQVQLTVTGTFGNPPTLAQLTAAGRNVIRALT